MSKAKKIVLATLALAAAVAGNMAYKEIQANKPVLVGKCYMMEDGMGLAIVDTTKLEDPETGKEVEVYVGLLLMGPFQIPQPLKIRETNQELPKMVAEKKATEVNCETGEPVSK